MLLPDRTPQPKWKWVRYSRYVIIGHEQKDGTVKPIRRIERSRSRYSPHQGMKERLRRIKQAFRRGELSFDVVV